MVTCMNKPPEFQWCLNVCRGQTKKGIFKGIQKQKQKQTKNITFLSTLLKINGPPSKKKREKGKSKNKKKKKKQKKGKLIFFISNSLGRGHFSYN